MSTKEDDLTNSIPMTSNEKSSDKTTQLQKPKDLEKANSSDSNARAQQTSRNSRAKFPRISIKKLSKTQPDKLRWYLVIGGCVVMTILVIVIVALAVHFAGTDPYQETGQVGSANQAFRSTTNTPPGKLSNGVTQDVVKGGVAKGGQNMNDSEKVDGFTTTKQTVHTHEIHTSITSPISTKAPNTNTNISTNSQLVNVSQSATKPTTANQNEFTLVPSTFSNELSEPTTGTFEATQFTTESASKQDFSSEPTTETFEATQFTTYPADITTPLVNSSHYELPTSDTTSTKHTTSKRETHLQTSQSMYSSYNVTTTHETKSTPPSYTGTLTSVLFSSGESNTPRPVVTNAPPKTTPSGPYVSFRASRSNVDLGHLSLQCEGIHINNWNDLHIISHHDNKHYTVAMVASGGSNIPSVTVLDPTFTSQISYKEDAVAFSLCSDDVYCSHFRNYSCTVRTTVSHYTEFVYIKDDLAPPVLTFPDSIVEGKVAQLRCSAALFNTDASLKWKIRPPGIYTYYDLSGNPTETSTKKNCSTIISSTLQFTPSAGDNGADIRCVVEKKNTAGTVVESAQSDEILLVVPSNFCDNKILFTMHNHPYKPCNMVVYCFRTGPLVYAMNCEAGKCYDINKTECVATNS